MQLGMGILVAAAMRAALECNVADHLADGPKSVKDLARAANVNEDSLYRVLRALSTAGVFNELADHTFANTPASEVMRTDHPAKARDALVWMSSPFHFRTYSEFRHSVKTGDTCVEKAVGMPVFEYFPTHGETNREFNNAMTSISAMVVPEVLATYDFSGLGTLCDVAGGHGYLLTNILKKHSDLQGILFDLEHVVEGAKLRIAQMGLESRCTTASGDFFQSVPAADSYIMKHIIHDWEEEKAILILRNCLKAMRGNGKVLLVESVLPGPNIPAMGKWIDLEMLAMPGGKERTEDEYRALLAKAGLKLNRAVLNKSPMALLEAVRA
jgi:hypothetical protein